MNVSTKQQRIAEMASNHPEREFISLNHFIDLDWLREAYRRTRKDGAVGVDGQTAKDYQQNLDENLQSLLNRFKAGTYKAPPVRRTYIPKGNKGDQRPLGIPTLEDKVLQRAVVMLLEPIYEADFKEFSFGFRPGKSAHHALKHVHTQIMRRGGRWIIDVDVRKYFDTINHVELRKLLDRRMKDGVIRKMIDKWLKAGVMDGKQITYAKSGTPQGGVISPLLANIYLHYILDEWFVETVQPRLKGSSGLTRYADDFVMAFARREDCLRVYEVLGKRFGKYFLDLHEEKTKVVDFRPEYAHLRDSAVRTFDFLGFTHHWGKSKKGNKVLRQTTSKSRFARSVKKIQEFCKRNRHKPMSEQHDKLSKMLAGHYVYYGITGNSKRLQSLWYVAQIIWHKWLCRRSRKSHFTYEEFYSKVLQKYPLPSAKIYHRYSY